MLIGSMGGDMSQIKTLAIGDALEFTFTDADFPASLYTMEFVLTLAGTKIGSKAGTPSGNSFTVSLTNADTKSYQRGKCQAWFIFTLIADSTKRYTNSVGLLYILPDPTKAMVPSADMLALDRVKHAITSIISQPEQSVSFNGQSYSTHNITDLYGIRDRLQNSVDAELREMGIPGKGSGFKTIRTRFVS